jgi:hypothetical protein
MPFDPQTQDILQQATNFFVPAWEIGRIIIGVFLGAFVVKQLISLFRKAN